MISAYIALGSNLNNPIAQIDAAMLLLHCLPDTKLMQISSYYKTAPVGYADQPDFINVVIKIHTSLTAQELLNCLQQIELKRGRLRSLEKNGPRILDLDLLLFGEQIIADKLLNVPHPRMLERAFVLIPLSEIAPTLHFPQGHSISFYCDRLSSAQKSAVQKVLRSEHVEFID